MSELVVHAGRFCVQASCGTEIHVDQPLGREQADLVMDALRSIGLDDVQYHFVASMTISEAGVSAVTWPHDDCERCGR